MTGSKYAYLTLLGIQLILCYLAFPYFFEHGFDGSFCAHGDGFKNTFTMLSFINEPIGEKGIFHFDFFQYPYGDYVYTADNTPLYAIAMRWINHYLFPVGPYAIPVFNALMIANVIGCSLLLFYLGRKYFKNPYWVWLLAIVFPWITEQFLRLDRGHYNLSLSSIFVVAMILCDRYVQLRNSSRDTRLLFWLMIVWTLLGYMIHGYYLPILCVFFAVFLLVVHLLEWRKRKDWKPILVPFIYILVVGIVSYSVLYLTDGYLSMRQQHAMSFNVNDQKLFPSYLYQSYWFNSINFPLRVDNYGSFAEPHMYMGHVFWAGFLFFCLQLLMNSSYRAYLFSFTGRNQWNRFGLGIIAAAFISFTISLGTNIFGMLIRIKPIPVLNFEIGSWSLLYSLALVAVVCSVLFLCMNIVFAVFSKDIFRKHQPSSGKQFIAVVLLLGVTVLFLFTNVFKFTDVPNLVNPFFYLQKLTRIVEQFRSLSRFAWPFILVSTFFLFLVLDRSHHLLRKWQRTGLYIMLGTLSFSQIADVVTFYQYNANLVNRFSPEALSHLPEAEKGRYAAIVPIPFFMVGCEDYTVTIDDHEDFSNWLFRFAYKNELPVMASKLSRTPVKFSKEMLEMLIHAAPPDDLRSLLPGKPLLVIVSRDLMLEHPDKVRNFVKDPEINRTAYQANLAQFDFIKKANLDYLYTRDNLDFYEWNVK